MLLSETGRFHFQSEVGSVAGLGKDWMLVNTSSGITNRDIYPKTELQRTTHRSRWNCILRHLMDKLSEENRSFVYSAASLQSDGWRPEISTSIFMLHYVFYKRCNMKSLCI